MIFPIIVEDSTWNITTGSGSTKLPDTTLINNSTIGKNTPIGLLNSYEYYLSYKNSGSTSNYAQGYLKNDFSWWLLNPYNSSFITYVSYGGGTASYGRAKSFMVRPAINLKSTIKFFDGTGSVDNPYRILDDKEEPMSNTTLLNTRVSGEYVIFDEDGDSSTNEIYRIVGIEDGKTKLNKNDYIRSGTDVVEKMFSTSSTYGNGDSEDYWDYYLNNTWYNSLASKSMLDKGTYYVKAVSNDISYKNSLCNTSNTTETTKSCTKTTSIWNGYVGLPRHGEMFASVQGKINNMSERMWLITPYGTSSIRYIYSDSNLYYYDEFSTNHATRPSIYLKSNVVITGGDGTKSNPFTIALKD